MLSSVITWNFHHFCALWIDDTGWIKSTAIRPRVTCVTKNNVNSSYIQVGPAILTNYHKQNAISNYKASKYMLLKTHSRGYYVCCWLQIVCFFLAFPYTISLLHIILVITSKLLLTSHFICLIANREFFSRIEWHVFVCRMSILLYSLKIMGKDNEKSTFKKIKLVFLIRA